ncbi:MAG: signal peptidase I [Patescibacteria group bacterium]
MPEKKETFFVKIVDSIADVAETFTVSVLLFLFVYAFLAFPEIVVGASMDPTLNNGHRLLVERLSVRFNKLKRGDIIIFNPPGSDGIDFVKRIVGVSGETLVIKNCRVYLVEGSVEKVIEEPYINSSKVCTTYSSEKLIKVPGDSFFVLGDNRQQSADSRVFSFLKKERIGGRVFLRFWPLTKLKLFL